MTQTDPIPSDDELFTLFAWIVGKNAIAWAKLEHEIELLIDLIYIGYNGHSIEKVQPTRAFNKKVRFLNKWRKSPHCPTELCDRLENDDLITFANRRNELIHGDLMGFSRTEYGKARFRIIERKNDRATITETELDFKILEARAEIALKWAEHYYEIALELEPETVKQMRRANSEANSSDPSQ